jgi:hypothetical protein
MNRMRDYSMKIFFYHGFAWMGTDRAGCFTYAERGSRPEEEHSNKTVREKETNSRSW